MAKATPSAAKATSATSKRCALRPTATRGHGTDAGEIAASAKSNTASPVSGATTNVSTLSEDPGVSSPGETGAAVCLVALESARAGRRVALSSWARAGRFGVLTTTAARRDARFTGRDVTGRTVLDGFAAGAGGATGGGGATG